MSAAAAATAVADRADRTAVQGQMGMVSMMMSMDEEEQSAEAKQCLKALKEGKRCSTNCHPPACDRFFDWLSNASLSASCRGRGLNIVFHYTSLHSSDTPERIMKALLQNGRQ